MSEPIRLWSGVDESALWGFTAAFDEALAKKVDILDVWVEAHRDRVLITDRAIADMASQLSTSLREATRGSVSPEPNRESVDGIVRIMRFLALVRRGISDARREDLEEACEPLLEDPEQKVYGEIFDRILRAYICLVIGDESRERSNLESLLQTANTPNDILANSFAMLDTTNKSTIYSYFIRSAGQFLSGKPRKDQPFLEFLREPIRAHRKGRADDPLFSLYGLIAKPVGLDLTIRPTTRDAGRVQRKQEPAEPLESGSTGNGLDALKVPAAGGGDFPRQRPWTVDDLPGAELRSIPDIVQSNLHLKSGALRVLAEARARIERIPDSSAESLRPVQRAIANESSAGKRTSKKPGPVGDQGNQGKPESKGHTIIAEMGQILDAFLAMRLSRRELVDRFQRQLDAIHEAGTLGDYDRNRELNSAINKILTRGKIYVLYEGNSVRITVRRVKESTRFYLNKSTQEQESISRPDTDRFPKLVATTAFKD